MKAKARPRLAVWKFASCDGCQLSLLDCEDELLRLAQVVQFANFVEASSKVSPGPYDLSLVEGSITTEHDRQRIVDIRASSRILVTIGACATSGGIQALRNGADVAEFTRHVYAHPEYISTLATSTPMSAHVKVDYELFGCPISKSELLEVVAAFLQGRKPRVYSHAVCVDCKLRGTPCLTVTRGEVCLGPVTHAGCQALCPSYGRGCFGCFGPKEASNPSSLAAHLQRQSGLPDVALSRLLNSFAGQAPAFVLARKRLHGSSC